MTHSYYVIYDWPAEECEQLLGEEICDGYILAELDEPSQSLFYGRRFNPIKIECYRDHNKQTWFRVYVCSIDDASINFWWSVQDLYKNSGLQINEAVEKMTAYMNRVNWMINREGIQHYMRGMFGDPTYYDYDQLFKTALTYGILKAIMFTSNETRTPSGGNYMLSLFTALIPEQFRKYIIGYIVFCILFVVTVVGGTGFLLTKLVLHITNSEPAPVQVEIVEPNDN